VDEAVLAKALEPALGAVLANELSADFVKIRRDYATRTLERASPGKFVETFVQSLQQIATGKYDAKPEVDVILDKRAENFTTVPEGLRICGARIARAMYTLRNKRNIAHKNDVDPNSYDLAFLHQGAAWIMAELLRIGTGISMQEAGKLIELIQTPVGTLVEEIDGTRLVHADLIISDELLVLLHSHYPQTVPLAKILDSLSRWNHGSVKNKLADLWERKLIHGDNKNGYRLTQAGYAEAVRIINDLSAGVTI
jgi:hypothetical protein